MGKIHLTDMAFYAYHGCFEEEQQIGNQFIINLTFEYDSAKAELSDTLNDAIDYQAIYQIIETRMKINSKLLEHLAHGIIESLKAAFPSVYNIKLQVSKLSPPIGGKMQAVSFELTA